MLSRDVVLRPQEVPVRVARIAMGWRLGRQGRHRWLSGWVMLLVD
jgi:hypothetical protein